MSIDIKQLNQSELNTAITGAVARNFNQIFNTVISSGFYVGSNVVYASGGSQTIYGEKAFAISPTVPYVGGTGQAVSLSYLNDQLGGMQTSGVERFSGLVVTNYLYVPLPVSGSGAVNVNYLNSLNLFSTSGNQVVSGQKTFTGRILVPLASSGYDSVPFVQFVNSGNSYLAIANSISGQLSYRISALENSGVKSLNNLTGNVKVTGAGNVIVYSSGGNSLVFSGSAFSGPSGASGQSFKYRGGWAAGIGYDYFDWINLTGASFVNLSGHTSSTAYKPYEGSPIWALLASGSGPTGAKGDPAILFNWKGNWNQGTQYVTNDAVYLSGSAYGYTGLSPVIGFSQAPGAYSNWSLVVNGQGVDTSAFYPVTNPSGFVTASNSNFVSTSQTGQFAAANHFHNYVQALRINGVNYTGNVSLTGVGATIVTSQNGVITISGAGGGGGGGASASFNYKGPWDAGTVYFSGDLVSYNSANYFYPSGAAINGNTTNPIKINSPWVQFGERSITAYSGYYNANTVYYPRDLAKVIESNGTVSEFINLGGVTLKGVHPYGHHNSFIDCDLLTGKNLLFITAGTKNSTHPLFGSGDSNTFLINGTAPNENYSGYNGLTLTRGETYYFDKEITQPPFILTTNSLGGSYTNQITNGLLSGSKLLTNPIYYSNLPAGNALYSGVFRFTPNASHPNTIYFQSPTTTHAGYKINIVDSNPWSIFSSGSLGPTGARGADGVPGLAFSWKGNWNSTTSYAAYDSVYYNGSSWGTLTATSSVAPFEGSLVWFKLASAGSIGVNGPAGMVWSGDWDGNTNYQQGDAVSYIGGSFASRVPNFGIVPNSNTNVWAVLAKQGAMGVTGDTGLPGLAFAWRGDWNPSTAYASGNSVYFNGSSYATKSPVISTTPPLAPWFVVAREGGTIFSWRGGWNSSTAYYNGDSVSYAGASYATQQPVSGENPINSVKWFVVAQSGAVGPAGPSGNPATGVRWRGPWHITADYAKNDIVSYYGGAYIVTSGSASGVSPYTSSYQIFTSKGDPLFTWQGAWGYDIIYSPGSSVYYEGSSYATLSYMAANMLPTSPSSQNSWFLVSKGQKGAPIRHTFYSKAPVAATDLGIYLVEKSGIYTGCHVAQMNGASSISGDLYIIGPTNTRTSLAEFGLTAGEYFKTYPSNLQIPENSRIGYNLTLVGSAASGVSVSILGYSP